jgi:hypothetical protein
LIAVCRWTGSLLLAAGVCLLLHLNSDLGRSRERMMRAIGPDLRRPFLHRIVAYMHHLHVPLCIAAIVAIGYGVLGWSKARAVARPAPGGVPDLIATSLFVPFELMSTYTIRACGRQPEFS